MKGLTGFRMCIACRKYGEQAKMIRVMRSGGALILSPGKKTFGRSAYLCRSAECAEKALKRGLLKKHLKCDCSEAFGQAILEAVHES